MKTSTVFLFVSAMAAIAAPLFPQENTISEDEAWKLGWPTMQGPYGNYRVPQTGAKLVDDLTQAKLVWESETRDFGRAKHTTGSFKGKTPQDRAQKIRDILGTNPKNTPGGWAAPILAEGKVFATTFKPAGKLYDVQVHPANEEEKRNPDHGQGPPRGGRSRHRPGRQDGQDLVASRRTGRLRLGSG